MPGSIFNPIELLFSKLMHTIPQEILDVAFNPKRDPRVNIDNVIRKKVLDPVVLPDINRRGARTKDIMLRNEMAIMPEMNDNDKRRASGKYSIYKIPKELLEGGDITSVTAVNFPNTHNFSPDGIGNLGTGFFNHGNTMLGAAQRLVETSANLGNSAHPSADLVGTNLVKLTPSSQSHLNYVLTFKINYDADLNNLGEAAIGRFIDLSLCAIKSYVYNTLILKIDKGFVAGGFEIGAFAEIVRSYSDQQNEYNEKLLKFAGASVIADPKEINRLLWYIL